jgi:hypothetical protein
VAATGAYQRSHVALRSVSSWSPMPVTRTSLAAGAVVAVMNRCLASRSSGATRSSTLRSTPGRHDETTTVGTAKNTSSTSTGLIDASSTNVTPNRRIQPAMVNTDRYMWSSTKTWLRRIERRSR